MSLKLTGLVAATHTPFDEGDELRLDVVERQAEHLGTAGVSAVFVGGSTGESHSLTVDERLALAERWSRVVAGSNLKLVVHVGSNCLSDAKALAAQAEKLGASAVSALAPSYFKPRSLDALIDWCAAIAASAPGLPFYFYDIPAMTDVRFSMPDFLGLAPAKIPNLAGLKFTNSDLVAYQRCLRVNGGRFDIPWGYDECLLAALALGATGAVGSTYNLAAPVYLKIIEAVAKGDLATAREHQYRSVALIELLASFGFIPAAKATMEILGVAVGPARPPHGRLAAEQVSALRAGLEELGFFGWFRA